MRIHNAYKMRIFEKPGMPIKCAFWLVGEYLCRRAVRRHPGAENSWQEKKAFHENPNCGLGITCRGPSSLVKSS